MDKLNKEKGVTLVSLVITIIVLVILSGVTLSTLVGDNGIITKAQEVKQNMENATAEEDELIQNLLNEIKGVGEGSEGEPEIPDVGISFGEVIWENGKAKITIQSSEEGKKIQYQINGEGGEWKDIENGGTIGELVHGDKIYARLYDESGSGGSIIKRIEDKTAPKVEVKVGEITGTSIEVEVTATENESGLLEVETYQYCIGEYESIDGRSTSNTYVYDELEPETEYKIVVKVSDKAGNEGKGETTATTMQPEPTGWKFVTCLTTNTEYKVPKDGTYRITCIGKSANGTSGKAGRDNTTSESGRINGYYYGGNGGNGGGSGGIARSILSLKTTEKVHCTIDTTISSFGNYLFATAASGVNPGSGTGGNDFNTTGNMGGTGGVGQTIKVTNNSPRTTVTAKSGIRGEKNGAIGGTPGNSKSYDNGGGGGGGATYNLPEDIAYDDSLYTTYIALNLSSYSGGKGVYTEGQNVVGYTGMNGSSYPNFSPTNPRWFGGGNGGGGGSAHYNTRPVGVGSAGSPGGILIEEAIYE